MDSKGRNVIVCDNGTGVRILNRFILNDSPCTIEKLIALHASAIFRLGWVTSECI